MTGPQLRIIRECAGISQLALGKMLGISQTWVSRFERGLSLIPESVAEKVAMVLPQATLEAQTAKTEEIRAREWWQKKTDAYLKEHQRGRPRKEKRTVKEPSVAPPAEVRSSPRPWGCFSVGEDVRKEGAVFPTPVGVFPPRERRALRDLRLPHARGGVSPSLPKLFFLSPSSPRPWGCFG